MAAGELVSVAAVRAWLTAQVDRLPAVGGGDAWADGAGMAYRRALVALDEDISRAAGEGLAELPAGTEVYRSPEPGAYLPAKAAGWRPCWHVGTRGTWHEVYDPGPPAAIVAVYYGTSANTAAMGEPVQGWELPPRVAARVAELAAAAEDEEAPGE
jgi:hypothetical protein